VSLENFKLSEANPNDGIGGKGCLCHPEGEATGREGPFVIFHASSTDSTLSPHAVVCAGCIKGACRQIAAEESEVPADSED
jgi:hypothetical protein